MTILDEILVKTRLTVAADMAAVPAAELESRIADMPPARDFVAALAKGAMKFN